MDKGASKFKATSLLEPDENNEFNARSSRRLALELIKEVLAASPPRERASFDLTTETGLSAAKQTRDPRVFHKIAVFAAAYDDGPLDLFKWLVSQPEFDRGTAAWLLHYLGPDAWVSGVGTEHSVLQADEVDEVLRQICVRSEQQGFESDVVGLEPDISFTDLEASHAQFGMPDGAPWPALIVSPDFPSFSPGSYDVGQAGLLVRY